MTVLDKILADKRARLALRSSSELADVTARAVDSAPTRGFLAALQAAAPRTALIAEVKKASPVAGVLKAEFHPDQLGKVYAQAGAHALSVLTDEIYFQGSEQDLQIARAASGLPVLRKDFTVGAYDIYEARAMGADAVLLIAAALTDQELADLHGLANSLGLDALVETHTEAEVERAVRVGASLIGVNNRDLETFQTGFEIGERVLPHIPESAFPVAESAMRTREDVERMVRVGARAVLIGTALSTQDDGGAAVRTLMGW